jgi:hypothetical protein
MKGSNDCRPDVAFACQVKTVGTPVIRPGTANSRCGRRRAVDRGAQWLLAQHLFARVHGAGGPRHVQLVGQRNVNGINVRVGQQVLVAAVGPGDAEFAGHGLGLCFVAGCDGNQVALGAC